MSAFYDKLGWIDSSYFHATRAMAKDSSSLEAASVLLPAIFKKVELNSFENPADSIGFFYEEYSILRGNIVFTNSYLKVILAEAYSRHQQDDYKGSRENLDKYISVKKQSP